MASLARPHPVMDADGSMRPAPPTQRPWASSSRAPGLSLRDVLLPELLTAAAGGWGPRAQAHGEGAVGPTGEQGTQPLLSYGGRDPGGQEAQSRGRHRRGVQGSGGLSCGVGRRFALSPHPLPGTQTPILSAFQLRSVYAFLVLWPQGRPGPSSRDITAPPSSAWPPRSRRQEPCGCAARRDPSGSSPLGPRKLPGSVGSGARLVWVEVPGGGEAGGRDSETACVLSE